MLPESAVPRVVLVFAVVFVSCLLLYGAADSLRFLSFPSGSSVSFPYIFPSLLDNDSVPVSTLFFLVTRLINDSINCI